ncbi:biotin synthase [Thermocrinis albus DSM 14484]|uniref:Biotin synthase n=1 Tax=Thermocrinis albus (strain DSM 14484 / JCM 11386 / HI 11/12) TaxID=638303 RepID=D3SLC8_THEAH|nr:biotin synthase BioB [Thermocrinis albus]ADC89558.1 biotin synthase [Thermocrinis albus DSM 14484]
MDQWEKFLIDLGDRVIKGDEVTREEALKVLQTPHQYISLLVYVAQKVNRAFHSENQIEFCSIINAKSGACSEDCRFCAQSKFYKTPINVYPLVPEDEILEGALRGVEFGANRYCVVLSGKAASKEEVDRVAQAVRKVKSSGIPINVCVSMGTLDEDSLLKLKEAGVRRVNHNLEASRNFFPNIVSTHTWEDRYETIKRIKKAGLSACCGGIFGMGESEEDRVDLALTYRELEVDSIPLNFLMPIPGTPLEEAPGIEPMEALKVIAMFRLTNPRAELRLCGGREQTLRDFHGMASLMVNAMMVGGYLTRAGRDIKKDYQLLEDLKAQRKHTLVE